MADREQILTETKRLYGDVDADFSFITDDLIASDSNLPDANMVEIKEGPEFSSIFGNNMRYGTRTINGQNYSVYYFESGPNGSQDQVCFVSHTWFAVMNGWHHNYIGRCGNREAFRFDRS